MLRSVGSPPKLRGNSAAATTARAVITPTASTPITSDPETWASAPAITGPAPKPTAPKVCTNPDSTDTSRVRMFLNSKGSISMAGTNIQAIPNPVRANAAITTLPARTATTVAIRFSAAGSSAISRRLVM